MFHSRVSTGTGKGTGKERESSTELKKIIRSASASVYIGTKEFSFVCLSVCYVVFHFLFCSKCCLFHILVDPCNDCTPVYRVSCREAPNGRRY